MAGVSAERPPDNSNSPSLCLKSPTSNERRAMKQVVVKFPPPRSGWRCSKSRYHTASMEDWSSRQLTSRNNAEHNGLEAHHGWGEGGGEGTICGKEHTDMICRMRWHPGRNALDE
mmetsp:Transcript_18130/g.38745  ORF Transcript_18130/g.38745 Transcript_18130/m.38745 type:complete len:115 (+) Transcript_18130:235-579(+)